ncbi:hypothetical protein D9M73_282690 [compost metagenome]
MSTVAVQHADVTTTIAEGNQVFAQDANGLGQLAKLFGEAYRMPEAAHVLAHLGARPDAGQLGIFGRDDVVVVTTVRNVLRFTIGTAHGSILIIVFGIGLNNYTD